MSGPIRIGERPPTVLIVSTVEIAIRAFLLPLARSLQERGWQVHGMARGITAQPRCREALDGVWEAPWTRRMANPMNILRGSTAIRSVVRRTEAHVVHVHTPIAAFVTRFGLRRLRKKGRVAVVYTAHGFHHSPHAGRLANRVYLSLERLAARWTDHLVVMNREDYELAITERLLPPDRIHLTRGVGIATDVWTPSDAEPGTIERVRSELSLTDDDHLILMVAEFIPRKRHVDLVRAIALLDRRDIHVALVGPRADAKDGRPELYDDIVALARSLDISDRVHFLGVRSDIHALMRSSTATVLPSQREGRPMVVLESLASGIPVIGADVKGTRDLLEGGGGLLFPVGDIGALADRIRQVVGSRGLRERLGSEGRLVALQHRLEDALREQIEIVESCVTDRV